MNKRLSKCIETLQGIVKLLFFSSWKKNRFTASATEVVILGNGPSLASMLENNSHFLSEKELIAVNYFALSDVFFSLKPRHYVLIDFAFYHEPFDDNETLAKRKTMWENIARANWEIHLYLPHSAKKHTRWQQIIGNNKHVDVHYINVTAIEGYSCFRHWCYKKMLGMPRPHNVIVPALMIALKMQFKKIYLWGVDHSWLSQISVDDNNRALVNNRHFYDTNGSKPSRFIVKTHASAPLHVILYTMMTAFESYFIIAEYARKCQSLILNQTRGSMIDAFERDYLSE